MQIVFDLMLMEWGSDKEIKSDEWHRYLSDAIVILDFLFLRGAPPPAPFPTPDADPTEEPEDLECVTGLPLP